MLLENYTGDSKVLKAIAHILNRKAPLPLDGDGDADFGTNGQVLTTDGSGATSWTTPSSGGDSVKWTQIQASGTKIAEIEINGTSQNVYAPNGGGGGGGHTIWNRIKTALTSRSNLWFADAKISDASADDATKVEVLTELADETAFDNLPTDGTADGMYAFPDSGAEYLDASMVGYGSGTVEDALDSVISPTAGTEIAITSFPYTLPSNGYIRAVNPGGSFSERYYRLATYGYISLVKESGNDIRYFTKGIQIMSAYGVDLRFIPLT